MHNLLEIVLICKATKQVYGYSSFAAKPPQIQLLMLILCVLWMFVLLLLLLLLLDVIFTRRVAIYCSIFWPVTCSGSRCTQKWLDTTKYGLCLRRRVLASGESSQ